MPFAHGESETTLDRRPRRRGPTARRIESAANSGRAAVPVPLGPLRTVAGSLRMRDVNTVLLKLAKRAETYDRKHIIESFVDIGSLFTLLSNRDNQILFGRRGTGKTHVLAYLANEVQASGKVVAQLDMRTVGSTGGIYSDQSLGIPERATRLLADTLGAIHDQVLSAVIDNDNCDLARLAPNLDKFIEAASEVVVTGTVSRKEVSDASQARSTTSEIALGVSTAGGEAKTQLGGASKESTSQRTSIGREGVETFRVHFGSVGSVLQKLVLDLPHKELWVILDEWSEVPLDLQPYLADLLRRTLLPVRGVIVKIAAIEQRCNFRIADESVGHIGIEIGADAAASINLDEFLVFENNSELAKQFFRELLYRHVRAVVAETGDLSLPVSSTVFINELFTQRHAFDEFVRAAEGVPRDAINIIGIAAQRALDDPIGIPDLRTAGRTWYVRAKQQAVQTKPEAQLLLNWIVDEVIQHRQARAFLLGTDIKDALIDFLYDARVLHVIRQGISGGDIPGRRFTVYALDYGCYVDLINTTRAPKGLFEAEIEGQDSAAGFVEVPQTDFRSIRRAILDLQTFYATLNGVV
jgi:hypothetical protein